QTGVIVCGKLWRVAINNDQIYSPATILILSSGRFCSSSKIQYAFEITERLYLSQCGRADQIFFARRDFVRLRQMTGQRWKFDRSVRQVFLDGTDKIAICSGSPSHV